MRIVGLIAAALVLLAGCQGDPDVIEPDPTKSPTSTATPPEMPDQAAEDSDEGAVAFVTHWIDVYNHAARTGDVERLRSLSLSCVPCRGYANDFEELSAAERPGGDVWKLLDALVESETDGSTRVRTLVAVEEAEEQVEYRLIFLVSEEAPFTVADIREEAS